ncbi:phage gp6-like head-tail connector protein [Pseudomonas parafulva]|uniref:Phage gp6-like head-tail connector protein n=1 Tax=Pseudomonas parafulva TaxID=157782 RepID=A0AAI8KG61_9PSED|nr:head-tail connector protein [Pseudomonas parafulva]AXO90849.1 phage gp6-like head-tail connector protein [Pseudomonas parafulva]
MPFISMTLARSHLRDPGDDDPYMQLLIDAAEEAAMDYINRRVYPDAVAMQAAVASGEAGAFPMVATSAIKSACLLILGHLYANREDVVVGTISTEMPRGSQALLTPYRVGWGV